MKCVFRLSRIVLLMLGVFLSGLFPLEYAFSASEQAGLQRGARLFMNYCSGCHSLRYLRYNRMAYGIGLVDSNGQVDAELLKNNLMFTQAVMNDPIRAALPADAAKQWFGVVPPDLSLIVREKGAGWLYSYLNSFYHDSARPFGTNNTLVPGVAMPDILESLKEQGDFANNVQDLVAFLAYVSQPERAQSYHIGSYVVIFLLILLVLMLVLKNSYWRKIT